VELVQDRVLWLEYCNELLGTRKVAKSLIRRQTIKFSRNTMLQYSSIPALGSTQPPIQWVPAALSSGVKRPGREVDHSPQTSTEVKKIWFYTSTPSQAFLA
jgi:hypothetical protein